MTNKHPTNAQALVLSGAATRPDNITSGSSDDQRALILAYAAEQAAQAPPLTEQQKRRLRAAFTSNTRP